jgi:hypothetical protein
MRLFVKVLPFLALQSSQPKVSQFLECLDSSTETLIRRVALICQDALQPFPEFLALVEQSYLFTMTLQLIVREMIRTRFIGAEVLPFAVPKSK